MGRFSFEVSRKIKNTAGLLYIFGKIKILQSLALSLNNKIELIINTECWMDNRINNEFV